MGVDVPTGRAQAGRAQAGLALTRPVRPHDRFPGFDGVRALAALMVVVYHAVFFNTGFATRGGSILGTLNAGVWIFFVTSGFLLYLPFAASHLAGGGAVDVRRYALRRVARIYPAYWLVLVFFTLFHFGAPRLNVFGFHGFVVHTTLTFTYEHIRNPFVVGLPPAWSLVVEVSFYAFLPLYAALVGAAARRGRPLAVELGGLALLLALSLTAIVAVGAGVDAPWITVLPQHLGAFALGMLLAVASARPWGDAVDARLARLGRPAWAWWTGAAAALVAIPVVLRLDPLQAPGTAQAVGLNCLQMLVGLCVVVPVVLGPQDHGALRRLLRSPVAVFLGLVSYGIYLWHWFVLQILAETWIGWPVGHGNWLVVLLVGTPIVVALAGISWYALERPILRVVHRVAPRHRAPAATTARETHALRDA